MWLIALLKIRTHFRKTLPHIWLCNCFLPNFFIQKGVFSQFYSFRWRILSVQFSFDRAEQLFLVFQNWDGQGRFIIVHGFSAAMHLCSLNSFYKYERSVISSPPCTLYAYLSKCLCIPASMSFPDKYGMICLCPHFLLETHTHPIFLLLAY